MNIRRIITAALLAAIAAAAGGCGNEDVNSVTDSSSKLEVVESTKSAEDAEGEVTTAVSTSKVTGTFTTRTGAETTAVTTVTGRTVVAGGGSRNQQSGRNNTSKNNGGSSNNNTNKQQSQQQASTQPSGGGNASPSKPDNGQSTETPTAPPQEPVSYDFGKFQSYQDWARETGYTSGALVPSGPDGINQDYYHTLSDAQNYTCGNIVVGDSRCCQMGIYEQRNGASDFAAFGVWGGHFISSANPPVLSSQLLADVEACFKAQIDACGKCDLYFFSSVNDYDFAGNDNAANISAAIQAAETLASLSYDNGNGVQHPNVYVIGFDGCWTTSDLWGTPQEDFNRYVDEYNEAVRQAVSESAILSGNAASYTTVPAIAGGKADFIDDGLHYSDSTIQAIASYIAS